MLARMGSGTFFAVFRVEAGLPGSKPNERGAAPRRPVSRSSARWAKARRGRRSMRSIRLKGQPVAIKRVHGARRTVVEGRGARGSVEAAVLESAVAPFPAQAHVDHFEEERRALSRDGEDRRAEPVQVAGARRLAISRRRGAASTCARTSAVLDYLHGRSPPLIHRDVNPRNRDSTSGWDRSCSSTSAPCAID